MINYKHLYYFWMVAKHGSITSASNLCHITPQTISGQIGLLEEYLNEKLFVKTGRNLKLSKSGTIVYSYADEIFSLGNELEESIRHNSPTRPIVIKLGISDVIPKSIAYQMLIPATESVKPIKLICRERNYESLLADLALHKVDMVLADKPIPPDIKIKGITHFLGVSNISFLASPQLTQNKKESFPQILNNLPFLLPSDNNLLQSELLNWFSLHNIHPSIVGEFDDSALIKVFGQKGKGVFAVPSAIAVEVAYQFNVAILGETNDVTESFYAITAERKFSHECINEIITHAKKWLKKPN